MNAYVGKNGQYQMRKSYCAYFDILGFKEKIENNDISFFNRYLKILNKELRKIEHEKEEFWKRFEIKVFTDNFVVGYPWQDKSGESELGDLFETLSMIQFNFIKEGIFIRGAIALSDLFMNDNVVLGSALIDAYNLESKEAVYPRIIISKKVNDTIKEHLDYYSNYIDKPQNYLYLKDVDGHIFVNYLYILFYDADYEKQKSTRHKNYVKKELESHKNVIIKMLNENINNYKVFDKYSWCARYHNFFCNNFLPSELYNAKDIGSLLISDNIISKKISRII